jgi:hypothetical protein
MRLPVLAIVAVCSACPVLAQEAPVFEQYEQARTTFHGDLGIDDYATSMPARLLDGLDGTWFAIGALVPETDDPAFFTQVCERFPVKASVTSPWSFSLEATTGKFTSVTDYAARGGSVFASHRDPAAELERFGVGEDAAPDLVARILAGLNGEATVIRPSADILVIQTAERMPDIYARCAG